jgi:hypothetical protein
MGYFVHDHEYAQGYMRAFKRYFSCNKLEAQVVLAKSVSIMYLPKAMKRLEAIEADPKRFSHDWIRQRGCAYLDKSLYVKHLSNLFEHFGREQVHVVFFEDVKSDPIRVCRMLFSLFDDLDATFVPDVKKRFNPAALPRSKRLALLTSTNLGLPIIRRALRRLLPDHMVDGFRDILQRLNERNFTPLPIRPETRTYLINYFKPFNDKLGELLGKDLSHWNEP